MNIAAISINHKREAQGLCQVSAILKANGHNVKLFVPYLCDNYINDILDYSPSMIIISSMSEEFPYYRRVLQEVKSACTAPVVVGGIHATVCPEIVLLPEIDYACVGEGEHFIVKMAEYIAEGYSSERGLASIPNLAFKTGEGAFTINPLAPLIDDLDSLPFVDRELYSEVAPGARELMFISSRGCPFSCTFCFNQYYRSLYADDTRKHSPVHFRSTENIMAELETLHSKYDSVYFLDDSLGTNKKLLMEMLSKYRARIGVPFKGNFRADQLDGDVVAALKMAGCCLVNFGVESGNETIRNKVLKKHLSNEEIYRAADLLHKAGIPFNTTNIYGYIGDNIELLNETIDFNYRIKAHATEYLLLLPFPKTEVANEISGKYGIPLEDFSADPLVASIRYYKNVPNIRNMIIRAAIAGTMRHDIKQTKLITDVLTKFGIHGYLMAKKLIKLLLTVKLFTKHPYGAIKMLIEKALNRKRDEKRDTAKINKYEIELVYDIPRIIWDEIISLG